jgi:hypothetical protein
VKNVARFRFSQAMSDSKAAKTDKFVREDQFLDISIDFKSPEKLRLGTTRDAGLGDPA